MKTLRYKFQFTIVMLTITVAVLVLFSTEKLESRPQQAKAMSKVSKCFTQVEHVDTEKKFIVAKKEDIAEIEPELDSEIILPEIVDIIDDVPTNPEAVKILQESYTQDEIVDEHWIEENTTESRKNRWEHLSFDEMLAQKQIHIMEKQLLESEFESNSYPQLEAQIKQLVTGKTLLVDLQCGNSLCRFIASLPYASSQTALLKNFSDKLVWVDRSFAKVEINPDDSRTLILYLTRKVT